MALIHFKSVVVCFKYNLTDAHLKYPTSCDAYQFGEVREAAAECWAAGSLSRADIPSTLP